MQQTVVPSVGTVLGLAVGSNVGSAEGAAVGTNEGIKVGAVVGSMEGVAIEGVTSFFWGTLCFAGVTLTPVFFFKLPL